MYIIDLEMIDINSVLIWVFLFLAIYIVYFRGYLLKRNHKHKCLRCGNCCRLRVKLSDEEIKKIKGLGYDNFLSFNRYLKKTKGYCIFLKFNNGISSCSIQDSKPRICNTFPNKKGIFGERFDCRCKVFYKNLW